MLHPLAYTPEASGDPSGDSVRDLLDDIAAYLENPKTSFRWDSLPSGTPFQERVWRQLRMIPPGEVRTYGELAALLGSGSRAVAGACRANRFPLLVPCHRVVSKSGLGGFFGHVEGSYLDIKRWLLKHEASS